jgi:hypothetical protein
MRSVKQLIVWGVIASVCSLVLQQVQQIASFTSKANHTHQPSILIATLDAYILRTDDEVLAMNTSIVVYNTTNALLRSVKLFRPPMAHYNESRGFQPTVHTFANTSMDLSPSTVVSAYYDIKSKYPGTWYDGWMANMLHMTDAMVIFTSADLVAQMAHHRSHAKNRTVIISLPLQDLQVLRMYNDSVWARQVDKDPWKKVHRFNHNLYAIWLSKPWFVLEAIRYNFFQSDFYTWTDMGCFRNPQAAHHVNFTEMVQHANQLPAQKIAHMAIRPPPARPKVWYDERFGPEEYFYHSGSISAGNASTWHSWYHAVRFTMEGFLERDLFIGDDQLVFQCACILFPDVCAYAVFHGRLNDNKYFGLRQVLKYGNHTEWWFPSSLLIDENVTQEELKS